MRNLTLSTSFKKVFLLALFSVVNIYDSLALQAVGLQELGDEIENQKGDAFRVINLIMTIVLFAGIIYITTNLIGKRENSKGIIVSWVVSIVIWGIGNVLFNR